jgi:serine/threonine protein kinase
VTAQGYCAPELLKPEGRRPNEQTDIWSLGCILFELCTGIKAFPSDYNERVPFVPHEFDDESKIILFKWLHEIWNYEPERRPSADVLLKRLGNDLPTVPKLFRWKELFSDPEKSHTVTTELYEEAHLTITTLFGGTHIKVIVSGTRLAYTYLLMGQCRQAVSLFERMVDKQRSVEEAGEHMEWGMTLYGLGQAYLNLAEQTNLYLPKSKATKEMDRLREKGKKCFEECRSLHQTRSGKTDPNTLLSSYGVALAYSKFSDLQTRALKLAEITLRLQSQVLTPDHQDMLTTESLLVHLKYRSKRLLQALLQIKERRQSLGAEHPDTLESLAGIGWYYYYKGSDESIPYYQQSLDGRIKVMGPYHPKTATSASGLAWAYNDMEMPSIALFEKAEEALTAAFGMNDRRTEEVKSRLAELREAGPS